MVFGLSRKRKADPAETYLCLFPNDYVKVVALEGSWFDIVACNVFGAWVVYPSN